MIKLRPYTYKIPPTECPNCHSNGTEDDKIYSNNFDFEPKEGTRLSCHTCRGISIIVPDGLKFTGEYVSDDD